MSKKAAGGYRLDSDFVIPLLELAQVERARAFVHRMGGASAAELLDAIGIGDELRVLITQPDPKESE